MAQPRWTDERTEQLVNFVGQESPVSQATVTAAAEELGNSGRSISSKLRKLGFEVEPAGTAASKFTEAEEEALRTFVESNSGQYTYAEIAEGFADGNFPAKTIQGKILSMELTGHVKPAAPKETPRHYSEDEEVRFLSMVADGAFLEDIAEALDKTVQSVRGKALSFLRSEDISAIPQMRNRKDPEADNPLSGVDVSSLSVAEIAEKIGKTERGVKSMLTRRGLTANDYDGAKKKEKRSAE